MFPDTWELITNRPTYCQHNDQLSQPPGKWEPLAHRMAKTRKNCQLVQSPSEREHLDIILAP